MDRLLNVITGVSAILLVVILISVRRAHIRVEYSVTWLLAAAAMLILSLVHPLLDVFRNLFGLPDSPLTLFLPAGGAVLIMLFRRVSQPDRIARFPTNPVPARGRRRADHALPLLGHHFAPAR